MKHPAYANATIVKSAFEKGLKAHGEEKAISYWEERKQGFLRPYQQNLAKIETELSSPLLNRFTDQWKDQARGFAAEDPAKVLNLLTKVKGKEAARYERIAEEERAAQMRQTHHEYRLQDIYGKFKSLHKFMKSNSDVPSSFKEDLKRHSQELSRDHTFMGTLDAQEAKFIQRVAQGEELEEHTRSMNRGRGGMSL